MASKQIQQTLTHPNCEIPYVIDSDYYKISNNSLLGLQKAKHDGIVVFKNDDILVVKYNNDELKVFSTPQYKKTHSIVANQLRYVISDDRFRKDDILFEYDCFTNGIPSFGYNTFTMYDSFFGYNHEDSIVISESFAEKSKYTFQDIVLIPIYEYTLLDAIYNSPGEFIYFPGLGNRIKNNIICQNLVPKSNTINFVNSNDLKNQIKSILKNMSLSDFIGVNKQNIQNFKKEPLRTKINDGIVSGIKIHKFNRTQSLIDKKLQNILEQIYNLYSDHVVDTYTELSEKLPERFCKELLKQH
jgi:hypothetical protein